MSKQTSNVKYKLREFEWFEMETRVRQMVQDLLSPFSKRVFETMTNVNSLKAFTMDESCKLEELKKMIIGDPGSKEIDALKSLEKRQYELDVKITELRNLVGETDRVIDRRFEMQDQRLQENREIILNNMKLKERISSQIMEQNDNLAQFRTSTQDMMGQFGTTLNKLLKEKEDELKETNTSITKLTQRLGTIDEFVKQTEDRFEINKQEHLKFYKSIVNNEESFKLVSKEINTLNESFCRTKKLSNYVKDLQQKMNRQDFQLQHLSPLITQAQISQTLFSILPNKFKRKLLVYDHQKYSRMNNQIFESDYKKILNRFNGLAVLEAVQKRTTKQIIDMKRRRLINKGIDIDNLTHDLKQKYYKEVNILDEVMEEDDDHTKISAGVEKDEVKDIVEVIMKRGNSDLTELLKRELEDCRKYLVSMEEQLQHTFTKSNERVERVREEVDTLRVEQELNSKYINVRLESCYEEGREAGNEMGLVKERMAMFMRFCSLMNHLQIQDELDKQSISLFGIKETFNEEPLRQAENSQTRDKIIDFKKECFSCCGFPASTMAAFKMACLTYAPSMIHLENREYRREQILEMATNLLQDLKTDIRPTIAPSVASVIQTYRHNSTLTKQSSDNNIFLFNTADMERDKDRDLREYKESKSTKSKRVNTANTIIRTSARLSNSVRTSKRNEGNAQMLSTTFNQQKRKHSAFLS